MELSLAKMGDYLGSRAAILACRVILAEVGVARSQAISSQQHFH